MNDMIKAEREKIISRKPTKILFIIGITLIVAYFFLFQFGYTSVFYHYDTGKMDTVSGFTAIEQRKETADIFAGKLTPDILSLMEQKITEAKTATAMKNAVRYGECFSYTFVPACCNYLVSCFFRRIFLPYGQRDLCGTIWKNKISDSKNHCFFRSCHRNVHYFSVVSCCSIYRGIWSTRVECKYSIFIALCVLCL